MSDRYFKTIESIEAGSNKIIGWSLSIVGGSLLVILSSSYHSPDCQEYKLAYLLFAFGWLLIGISIYNGKNITNSKMAAVLFEEDEKKVKDILQNVNTHYAAQLKYFNLSLVVFAIWLLLYLFWWIFD